MLAVVLAGGLVGLAQQPRQVNDALLKTGSRNGEEWVAYGVNWAEQRYSPLNQITAENIGRLGLEWAFEIAASRCMREK
jgi:quinohemoprotein ethanol dehydrogenase